MNIIVIKKQTDLDALPEKFDTFTRIEIRSEQLITIKKSFGNSTVNAYGNSKVNAFGNSTVNAFDNSTVNACNNSTVKAYDNSTVNAFGNSTVKAYDTSTVKAFSNSTVNAFEFANVIVFSDLVTIKHLADCSIAILRGVTITIEKQDSTSTIVFTPERVEVSFETWLERGYVYADGIRKKLISRKTLGSVEVFTVEEFLEGTESFVVKRGEAFSHGETVEKAIADLRYKLSNRDTSSFKSWTLETEVSPEDAIQAYRAITGACEFGVKSFCESAEIPEKLTIAKIIKMTKDKFGSDKFAEFFNGTK